MHGPRRPPVDEWTQEYVSMSELFMSAVIEKKAFRTLAADGDKNDVIATLVRAIHEAGRLDEAHVNEVIDGALERESIGSTGIGHAIAIPHCRTERTDEIVCAVGVCPDGIDFDSLDGEPVQASSCC